MARIRKKRIRWEAPANSTGMRYRLYWATDENVGYDSQFVELGNRTEVVLPDDLMPFPIGGRNIQVGVSSINQTENESDITRLDVQLDFSVPDAPRNLQVLDVYAVPNSNTLGKMTLASVGMIVLIGVGVLALLRVGDRVLDHFRDSQ